MAWSPSQPTTCTAPASCSSLSRPSGNRPAASISDDGPISKVVGLTALRFADGLVKTQRREPVQEVGCDCLAMASVSGDIARSHFVMDDAHLFPSVMILSVEAVTLSSPLQGAGTRR